MFCHKCGNQAVEGAGFCNKCGVKFAMEATQATAAESTPIVEPVPQHLPVTPVPTVAQQPAVDTGFKEFVDNHVRTTTKFQSAQDLIENSKPLRFMWIIIGVSLLGVLGGPLVFVTLLFGYVAFFIAGGIIRMKYRSRFNGEFNCDINIEDLFSFLNGHLKQISPNFHEWSYMSSTGGLSTMIGNAVANAVKEVPLCTEYGPKKNRLAVLTIRQNPDDPTAIRRYFVDATKNGFNLDSRSNGMFGHSTLIRTAPILQAAMEYYIKTRV